MQLMAFLSMQKKQFCKQDASKHTFRQYVIQHTNAVGGLTAASAACASAPAAKASGSRVVWTRSRLTSSDDTA